MQRRLTSVKYLINTRVSISDGLLFRRGLRLLGTVSVYTRERVRETLDDLLYDVFPVTSDIEVESIVRRGIS